MTKFQRFLFDILFTFFRNVSYYLEIWVVQNGVTFELCRVCVIEAGQ